MQQKNQTDAGPRGLTPFRRWCAANNISAQTGYREANAGRLELVKIGTRTYVTPEADAKWRAALPRFVPLSADTATHSAAA